MKFKNIYNSIKNKILSNTENYKTVLTEIKDDLKKWKNTHHALKDSILMSILPELIYRFKAISFKIPMDFLKRNWQGEFKFVGKWKGPRIVKTILENNNFGASALPDFKTYHKAIVIKTVWYLLK